MGRRSRGGATQRTGSTDFGLRGPPRGGQSLRRQWQLRRARARARKTKTAFGEYSMIPPPKPDIETVRATGACRDLELKFSNDLMRLIDQTLSLWLPLLGKSQTV